MSYRGMYTQRPKGEVLIKSTAAQRVIAVARSVAWQIVLQNKLFSDQSACSLGVQLKGY